MRKLISFKTAINLCLVIFGLFVVFHLAIIMGIVFFNFVPIDFLWGGRMETKEQLLVFEFISLFIQVLCLFIILIRAEYLQMPRFMKIVKVAIWVLFLLFLLNTFGNIVAKTSFENFFGIVTGLLALLSFRIGIEKVLPEH